MMKPLAALLAFVAVVASTAGAQTTPPPDAAPAPSTTATPLASPTPTLLQFTGQLLDVRDHFVYFTTGDAFPIVEVPRILTYETGQLTTIAPQTKMYARATFDPAARKIIQLEITRKRLPNTAKSEALTAFVVVKSTPQAAPEIVGQKITGKQVAVVFEVTAPPTTAFTDTLFIATDASNWSATAIKLDRIDAYKYRALRYFASGTKFAYRVTRGTWNSVERGEDNLDAAPHNFFVREVDSLAARVTVYHWSDENPAHQGAGPNSIPTPFNSNPFGGGPGGILVPQRPTSLPTPFR